MARENGRLDTAVNVVLLLCAAAFAWSLARRELGSAAQSADYPPIRLSKQDWGELSTLARVPQQVGLETLIVFTDLECPYCAHLDRELRSKDSSRRPLRFGIIHFPIRELHRFAFPAAVASECAREQGRFDEFVQVVLNRQDSIGLIPWAAFARRAGVADTQSFAKCSKAASHREVEHGYALGKRLGLIGTPAIALNGLLYRIPPSVDSLHHLISLARKGQRRADGME